MKKLKLFIENFLVYGLGGIISKIVPLIMVPIVARLMPTSDYFGLSDMSNTVISFASAIAIMGMYDAVYRMFFEKDDEEYKKTVCSTALTFTFITSLVIFVAMIIFKDYIAKVFFSDRKYAYIVYLSAIATLVGATNSIVALPTRMQNKRKIFLITNTISPVLSYAVSIPMLLAGYYTIALPLAGVVSGITMELTFYVLNRNWFKLGHFDSKLLKQLLIIAVPLLPEFLIYWIFNSCDKVMITNMIGIGAAGIYAVGSKLGHASQLIYRAFAGGWQYFAFSTMNEDDQVKSNSMVFEYLGLISFIASAFICAWSFVIFKYVFPEEYLSGYIVAPYLFLAPLLQMLYQVISNQFLVIKKTWPEMLILLSGAVVNVIINYALIPILGIEGASIATLVGYVVSDIICVIVLVKMELMILTKKFVTIAGAMAAYIVAWRIMFSNNTIVGTLAAFALTIFMLFVYRDTIIQFIKLLRKGN